MSSESIKRLVLPPISPAAEGPLYRQIADGVRQAVNRGRLKPGDALPSFRGLAEQLLVSVITVKRAYAELENEGIIFRKQGLGTFVAELAADRAREVKRAHAAALFDEAVREGIQAALSGEELLDMAWEAVEKHKPRAGAAHRRVLKRA